MATSVSSFSVMNLLFISGTIFFRERQRRNDQKQKFIQLYRLVESHDKSTGLVKPEESQDNTRSFGTKFQVLNDVCI